MDRQNEMSTQEYWTRKAEQQAADAKADAEYARSESGMLQRLITLQSSIKDMSPQKRAEAQAEIDALIAKLDAIKAKSQAAQESEWTREVTMERREAWNTAIRSGKYSAKGGGVLVGKLQSEIGFTFDELKAAIKRHGL